MQIDVIADFPAELCVSMIARLHVRTGPILFPPGSLGYARENRRIDAAEAIAEQCFTVDTSSIVVCDLKNESLFPMLKQVLQEDETPPLQFRWLDLENPAKKKAASAFANA